MAEAGLPVIFPYVNSLLLRHKMNLLGIISLQEAILIAI